MGFVILAVASAVGYGIYVVGSPAGQRLLKFDGQRVSDLQSISHALDSYWDQNGKLPKALEELGESRFYNVRSIHDPATEQPYEYRVVNGNLFQLCAVFATDSSQKEQRAPRPFSAKVWDHGPGRVCFDLEAQATEARPVREAPAMPVPR